MLSLRDSDPSGAHIEHCCISIPNRLCVYFVTIRQIADWYICSSSFAATGRGLKLAVHCLAASSASAGRSFSGTSQSRNANGKRAAISYTSC